MNLNQAFALSISLSSFFVLAAPSTSPFLNREVVSGTISIDFATRASLDSKGNTKKGTVDTYDINLKVVDSEIKGKVVRTPEIRSAFSATQKPEMKFDLQISKANEESIKLSGPMTISSAGRESRSQTLESLLNGISFGDSSNKLSGSIIQAPLDKKSKTTSLIFSNAVVSPSKKESQAIVSADGALVYSYVSDMFIPSDLTLTYAFSKNETNPSSDLLSGNIKWIKDENDKSKSRYEMNIYYNEGQPDEGSLRGTINFVDTFGSNPEIPIKSLATYSLSAHNLREEQVTAFMNLWLLSIGPVNDE